MMSFAQGLNDYKYTVFFNPTLQLANQKPCLLFWYPLI